MYASGYASWSLEELKAAAAQVSTGGIDAARRDFNDGARVMAEVAAALESAVDYLAGGWHGDAAQGAIGNARSAYSMMDTTRSSAADAHGLTSEYSEKLQQDQAAVAAIPDVDTSWHKALSAGGLGGPLGAAAEMHRRQQEYERNRAQAATLVAGMDRDGQDRAEVIKAARWPKDAPAFAPPRQLAAPPGPDGGSNGGGDERRASVALVNPGGRRTPTRSPAGKDSSGAGAGRHAVPEVPSPDSTTPSASVPASGSGAVGVGVDGAPTTSGVPTGPKGNVPAVSTAIGIGGAAAVAAGVAGVRGPATGTGGGTRGAARLRAITEPGVPGEEAGRAGVRGPGGAVERPVTGPAARPVAGLAAGEPTGRPVGGYPVGGGARGTDDDEQELKPRPDVLVETDDVWNDGRLAAPPVIG